MAGQDGVALRQHGEYPIAINIYATTRSSAFRSSAARKAGTA
jgi:hypothetical protein